MDNMIKRIQTLTVLLYLLSSGQVNAQLDSSLGELKKYRNEIGIDVTALIPGLKGYSYYTNQYIMSFRRHALVRNQALRIQIAGAVNESTKNGNKNFSYSGGVRAGYEWQNPIKKKWEVYMVLDALFNVKHTLSTYDYGNDPRRSEYFSYEYGIAPAVGVKFKIIDRLTLSTEARIEIVRSYQERWQTYPMNPSQNIHEVTVGYYTRYYYPSYIILLYHF
ncbi:MAG: hypothetical protein COB85_05945 [Bacteroidetes bacterium]|nr:MAG: hypothetical protein COB85_05945 [Bacteroidota bacterium]